MENTSRPWSTARKATKLALRKGIRSGAKSPRKTDRPQLGNRLRSLKSCGTDCTVVRSGTRIFGGGTVSERSSAWVP